MYLLNMGIYWQCFKRFCVGEDQRSYLDYSMERLEGKEKNKSQSLEPILTSGRIWHRIRVHMKFGCEEDY